jgi:hypothetical protein
MQWVDDGSTSDASVRLTSMVRGTTLTGWEMKPPMQVVAAATAQPILVLVESGFFLCGLCIGNGCRTPTMRASPGAWAGLRFTWSSLRTHPHK